MSTAILSLLLIGVGAEPDSPAASLPQVRQVVAKSLPNLEKGGVAWLQDRGCASCHNVTFLLWSHHEARAKGFPVDARKLEEWSNWSLLNSLARGKEGGGIDTMNQLILGRDAASTWRDKPTRHLKTVDPFETIWEYIVASQGANGSWKPGGQLTTPPEITTAWALLALAARDTAPAPEPSKAPGKGLGPTLAGQMQQLDGSIPKARDRALAFLKTAKPDPSIEALMLRVLVERKFGQADRADVLRQELLARQNADGGWSNRADARSSDAFGTGLVLYGLGSEGLGSDHPAVQNAWRFLAESQKADGSWTVATRQVRAVEGDGRHKSDPIYTYWGSAWATIGLLKTLPAAPAKKE